MVCSTPGTVAAQLGRIGRGRHQLWPGSVEIHRRRRWLVRCRPSDIHARRSGASARCPDRSGCFAVRAPVSPRVGLGRAAASPCLYVIDSLLCSLCGTGRLGLGAGLCLQARAGGVDLRLQCGDVGSEVGAQFLRAVITHRADLRGPSCGSAAGCIAVGPPRGDASILVPSIETPPRRSRPRSRASSKTASIAAVWMRRNTAIVSWCGCRFAAWPT